MEDVSTRSHFTLAGALLLTLAGLTASPARGVDFPPITEKEKNLTEVPGAHGAPAVFLDSSAELWFRDLRNLRISSTLRVTVRLKVLTLEGVESFGEIAIRHSRYERLSNFEGRTVLPDGRELAVDKDAVFRRVSSRSEKRFITTAVFPSVEPGAILDWSYDLSSDSIFYLEPWYFQEKVPVLHSEITYHIPSHVAIGAWASEPPGEPFQVSEELEKDGRRVRVCLDNLPAIPDEPSSFPEEDLQAWFMLMPKKTGYGSVPLLNTWQDVCRLFDEAMYGRLMRTPRRVKRKARQIESSVTGAPQGDRRGVAEAIYRFVRDEIRTLPSYSVLPHDATDLGEVLESAEGNNAEKALLLRAMLRVTGHQADLVWVPDRWDGAVDITVPNPGWFERAIVRVHLPVDDGEEFAFLDPSDRRLGFGHLAPSYEDVPALVFDTGKPETIVIPLTPAGQSHRRATVELALDTVGRVTGSGGLELTGHHAWANMSHGEGPESLRDGWRDWLAERWEGFEVDGVEVTEDVENRRIEVEWNLAQRPGVVLSDEVSLWLSRPLGPISQIFQLEPEQRKTPVLLSFPDVDEMEVRLTWPESWELEVVAEPLDFANDAGRAAVTVTTNGDRSLSYSRNFTLSDRQFVGSEAYEALRTLYGQMEKSDTQALVLTAR